MTRWTSAIPVLLLWAAVTAFAQGGFVGGGSFVGIVASGVKGVPFSADTVTETARVLQDGNQINQVTHGKIYRDFEGRTRNESSMMMPGPEEFQHVSISDPVQQVFISFSTRGEKIATVHHIHSATHSFSPPPQGRVAAKPLSPRTSTEGRPCPVSPAPENLGTRVIEGYTVVGTRRTHTIDAGKMGNEKPIITITDSWYSDELHEVLLSERDDPQSGHHTTKLVNIQRIEPDPTLFQVPPDFIVRDDQPLQ
jgi:hypothetical protein